MVQSGHIQMCVFWILLPQFAAAVSSRTSSYFTVRVGDDVTLPCENVIKHEPNCGSNNWLYSTPKQSETVELVNLGKICESSKSDRLSLTADCSLRIERVTEQDAGLYTCRQFRSGQQGSDHAVHLSVIDITEQTDTDKVTLNCSVLTFGDCRHTVEWLIKSTRNIKISQSNCRSSVSIDSDRKDESITCEVTDNNNNVLLCSSEPQTPCERQPSVDTKTTTTLATTPSTQMTKNNKQMDENFNKTATSDPSTQSHCWWRLMVGSVGVAALISAVVVVNIWTRAKVRKSETDENKVCSDEEDAL
ncbi:uncharacterized protein LOC114428936 [Parambassis ranga]|uniref:Uncharacterized protein LOC114428936 n=1 Tax=Parambassis ranga TaxID=210632 RepID=A0A6P7HHV1_9TELE|nr:uncharacterized protein LOC114428936 [Parambassis ranga]